ncbi:putative blastopia polyprotein [Operophtera brumata]|uniref:Putative blastopia polyprotein n=1 Tax=Operophtera brumata TaxID=104452 RepID=A0A0L7L293_OPEBR|nr:putative blastopia polyprotein [Operophtera brumata]
MSLSLKFGVDKTYTSEKWAEDVDENAVVFQWTPVQSLIIARRSLIGVAALWLKTERAFKTFDDLKNAIVK